MIKKIKKVKPVAKKEAKPKIKKAVPKTVRIKAVKPKAHKVKAVEPKPVKKTLVKKPAPVKP
ncbi:MAG: hypothetical protein FJZ13_04470, partial [Candidatus Omnitrophica bacterium]|nr:hypothetical protein [Candidatus Omnitrophota bacterium]